MNGFPQFDLNGQTALVTGAARGLGRAIALALAHAGADVALGLRDVHAHGGLPHEIEALGRRALPLQMDVTSLDQIRRAVDAAVEHFGRLDILVNNAGIGLVGGIEETSRADFEKLLRVNVEGMFLVTRAAMPKLLESRGTIVNIGSVAGLIGVKRRFAYCATKGAVVALSRQLAVDYAGRVRVNCICPGTVETPFVEAYLEKFHKHEKDKVRAELHARQPVGRMGRPDEIASMALYLCSDEAAFVTGATPTIDGGWTAA